MAIHVVERMRKTDISDMSEARWNDNYTKLRLWQLPFRKLVFMDSDMVVLQPIRHLFAIPEPFAAVPDAFHPIYLNTGFMVLSPNEGTFNGLASLIDSVSSEESEQTLVNHWFLSRFLRPLPLPSLPHCHLHSSKEMFFPNRHLCVNAVLAPVHSGVIMFNRPNTQVEAPVLHLQLCQAQRRVPHKARDIRQRERPRVWVSIALDTLSNID